MFWGTNVGENSFVRSFKWSNSTILLPISTTIIRVERRVILVFVGNHRLVWQWISGSVGNYFSDGHKVVLAHEIYFIPCQWLKRSRFIT